jgi:glycerol-1-phosphate dehydrogenase [NAD(P)+]
MNCTCQKHFPINIHVDIQENSLMNIPSYLRSQNYRHIFIVFDQNTYQAAGKNLLECLTANNIVNNFACVQQNQQGDVVADEVSLVQILLEMPSDTDALIAVGTGTINDLVRFVSYKTKKPFISVPTAASVDGFASAGAPLIIHGTKVTVQTAPPIAIFADITILKGAPKRLTAAGFGDMLGKYTALVDWKFSHLMAHEPYCRTAAEWTEQSLNTCILHLDKIAEGTIEGIEVLIKSLIQSGLAMLLVGHSRSASGGEHHLSHYWEMNFLMKGKPQVLHGAKVGVATGIISDLYHKLFQRLLPRDIPQLSPYYEEIKKMVNKIPEYVTINNYLQVCQGPSSPDVLGISQELVQEALHNAYQLRDRFTILRFVNDNNLWDKLS